jgi:hypothetical protein
LSARKECGQKESYSTLMTVADAPTAGPLLEEVLGAQRAAERIVGDHVALHQAAECLVERCRELGRPLLWPVGEAAERLTGAVVLMGGAGVRVRGWTEDVRGQRVLVAGVADLTSLALQQAARQARHLGATEVHACVLNDPGTPHHGEHAAFDSYRVVVVERSASTTPALAMGR